LNTTKKYSEIELVNLLKSKSEEAYNVLYSNYASTLLGIINNIVRSSEASQDVLQNSFVKVWKNIDKYDRSKGTIFTWMLNISRNTAIDYTRSKHVKYKIQKVDTIVNTLHDRTENVNHDTIGLKKVVTQLKPEYQQVLDVIYFRGYTQQEASDELDIPLGTIKTRTRSAIIKLRELLRDSESEF